MWPFSAYRDFKNKLKRDANARERDRLVTAINNGIDSGVEGAYSSPLCDLCRHADDPTMPGIAKAIVERIEGKKGPNDALSTSIYLMNCMQNADVQSAVAETAFLLAAKFDRSNEREMAGVAMAANLIAFNAPEGSEARERSMALWREAVGTLSKTRLGVDFAFAAASNAALGRMGGKDLPHPLRGEAIESWYRNVTDLARIDPAAATQEALRIVDNYQDWGPTAPPFTAKAKEALNKLSFSN
jgi:hypothetical protein